MNWEDRPEVRKGNIGEGLVDEYLLRKGIVPYRPIASQAHPFDRLCASADKKHIYVVDVKTKPRREFYPDTGFNISNYNKYLNIAIQHNMDVFVYFVDEILKAIYGGELIGNLAQIRQVRHQGKLLIYPIQQSGIIYFPLAIMEHIADLPDAVCKELAALRTTTYEVKQSNLF